MGVGWGRLHSADWAGCWGNRNLPGFPQKERIRRAGSKCLGTVGGCLAETVRQSRLAKMTGRLTPTAHRPDRSVSCRYAEKAPAGNAFSPAHEVCCQPFAPSSAGAIATTTGSGSMSSGVVGLALPWRIHVDSCFQAYLSICCGARMFAFWCRRLS